MTTVVVDLSYWGNEGTNHGLIMVVSSVKMRHGQEGGLKVYEGEAGGVLTSDGGGGGSRGLRWGGRTRSR